MKHFTRPVWRWSIALAGLLSWGAVLFMGTPVRAALATFSFQGTLSQIDAPLVGQWSPGQVFSGTYTFDLNTPNAGAPGQGDYQRAPTDIQVTLGSYQLTSGVINGIGGLGSIIIQTTPQTDTYVANINTAGPSIGILVPLTFTLSLVDSTGTALTSNALSPVPPNLSLFQQRDVTFKFGGIDPTTGLSQFANATGQLTALTAVPLPAAALLFGSGLIGLASIRWFASWHTSIP